MRTTIAVLLAVCVMSLQGCIISIGGSRTIKEAPAKSERSAVQTTLAAIASLPSEEAKIATLRALAQTPMSEDDYIALIKAIETVNDPHLRQSLLMTSIDTRREAKSPDKTLKPCD